MATRRPRVKAAVNIAARRPTSVAVSAAAAAKNDSDEQKINVAAAIESPKNDTQTPINQCVDESTTKPTISTANSTTTINNTNNTNKINETTITATEKTTSNHAETNGVACDAPTAPTNNTALRPFRRMLTPAVNLPNRRRPPPNAATMDGVKPSLIASSPARSQEFAAIRSPSPTKADEKPIFGSVKGEDQKDGAMAVPSSAKGGISERRGTIDHDECFKSPPFMSPSMQYGRRPDPASSPFTDVYADDNAKSPASVGSNKIRPRIRPTPYFMVRRNSIQSQSEMDEETTRRQRHYSSSSMQGGYTPVHSAFPQRNSYGPNRNYSRNRTESVSSNISDVFSTRDYASKQKRSMRSEECQRVANAKREFNQRLNGNPPDKTRLTMYDLIYYNPSTNPMKKPAVKTEKREGDSVSVTSVRTIESRTSSVKTESSVKSESAESESNMPVPQLKLGPNGEIILDEKSLVIETTGDKEARAILANSDVVYDDEFSGTSGFYKRHKRTKDWPPEETIKFYRALQTIGTDFSVMLELFPNRTRRDLKLKFKKEERQNMALVNKALLHPKQFNIEMLKMQFEEEDRETLAKQEEWKEAKQKMIAEKKKQLSAARKREPRRSLPSAARSLLDGDAVYDNEFTKMPKLGRRRRKADLDIENGPDNPLVNPLFLNINKTPLRPSQTDSVFSAPGTPLVINSPKLPSFSEMMSSKSFIQKQNSVNHNNNIQGEPIKQHVYAPIGFSIPVDPPPMTYSIPTSVAERVEAILEPVPAITVSAQQDQPLLNGTLLDNYVENDNMTVKVDSADIMNMDIIFEDTPIVEDTSITASVPNDVGHVPKSFVSDASSTIFIISEMSDNDNGVANEVTLITDADDIGVSANVPNNGEQLIPVAEMVNASVTPDDYIVQNGFAEKPETIVKGECDAEENVKPNSEEEKHDPKKSSTLLPRKRKPPPMLVGRNKTQRKTGAEIETPKPPVQKPGTKEVHLSAFAPPEPMPSYSASSFLMSPSAAAVNTSRPSTVQVEQAELQDQAVVAEAGPSVEEQAASDAQMVVDEHIVNGSQIDHDEPASDSERLIIDEDVADDEHDDADDNPLGSLVVVETQDPDNPERIKHEVYFMCPETKQLSEQPLELSDEVIERIRSAQQ